ncbi:MAG: DUF1599 domain-containing protein [Bacteroidetes bacterium]|nr:DUF1599 domain-containing protein [Bacteroidota bacterium]
MNTLIAGTTLQLSNITIFQRKLNNTAAEYDTVIKVCKDLFMKKTRDYGTAWRILRIQSITDQIFIKAQRIRTLEEKKVSKVDEDITGEYIGIVNYCVIAMMQLDGSPDMPLELSPEQVSLLFDTKVNETKDLMFAKNHDYGEAWRDMRISSMTDLILMKLLRVKQIEDNRGQTLASEGVKANYQDMLNYAVFALIKLGVK